MEQDHGLAGTQYGRSCSKDTDVSLVRSVTATTHNRTKGGGTYGDRTGTLNANFSWLWANVAGSSGQPGYFPFFSPQDDLDSQTQHFWNRF